jgi:hypothetical protein
MFRTTKQYLGLQDCQSKKLKIQFQHLASVFLSYSFLQIAQKNTNLKILKRRFGGSNHKPSKKLKHGYHLWIRLLEEFKWFMSKSCIEAKIYALITGKQKSTIDCNVHLLFLTAIKYLKKLAIDYSKQLQEIVNQYQDAENACFFNRNSKITSAIELTRFYVISLCEKDIVYVSRLNFYHQHHYHRHMH